MRGQVLREVVDACRKEGDLHLARTGVLFVGFVLCDDLWLNNCGHFYVVELHDCREPFRAPCRPLRRGTNPGLAGVTVPARRDAGPVMAGPPTGGIPLTQGSNIKNGPIWRKPKFGCRVS